jgi:uroporphyrinogen-III synthase
VVNTGIGFRGWLEAADGRGVGERLHACLQNARLISRGPKPCGAIRAAGLSEDWSAPSESCEEILQKLLAEGIDGARIVVQLHGGPQEDFISALRAAGATVVEVAVYRWTQPDDIAPVQRLIDQILAGQIDAVTFTSAPAVMALLEIAGGSTPSLITQFNTRTMAACVGPVTAAPLRDRGVEVVMPQRSRLGALVKSVTDELPQRAARIPVAGAMIEIRGHGVLIDGTLRTLAPASMSVLFALTARPGAVVGRAKLAACLPRGDDGHAVEMAVARLRTALGSPDYVETVIKRGYRLRIDEPVA